METMKKISCLWICLFSLSMLGCPKAQVRTTTIHPDTATIVEVHGRLLEKTPADTRVLVNNIEIQRCTGDNPCVGTGGPYPAAGNSTIKLETVATSTDGKVYRSTSFWPVLNCLNHWNFTAPVQIPSSLATQTGPNLYQLSDPVVVQAAQDALTEYANNQSILVTDIDTPDELVAAVADYVDSHMTWTSDPNHNRNCINTVHNLNYQPGYDFPIPANYTIIYTGDPRCNCPTDYCGDCEDHAILRAALLRSLGFAPQCIWDVMDSPVTHEYNVVAYEGAYRIMDYGPITSWLQTHTWASHQSYYGWNEVHGTRGALTSNHTALINNAVNYKLHNDIKQYPELTCQQTPDVNNYYRDTCP